MKDVKSIFKHSGAGTGFYCGNDQFCDHIPAELYHHSGFDRRRSGTGNHGYVHQHYQNRIHQLPDRLCQCTGSRDVYHRLNHQIRSFSPTIRTCSVTHTMILDSGISNTIVMTVTTIVIKVFVVSITAYAFSKINFKGRDGIFLVLLTSLMIPSDIMLIPRYVIFKQIHILDTMWSLVLPATFDIYFVFMIRQSFIGIPEEISEAARIDGCSHFQIYSRIILPLAKPSIVTLILFTFVWSWNDYMGPYIFISSLEKQMLSVGIKLFTEGTVTDPALQMSAATLVLMPVLVLFLFSQKYFVEGVNSSAVKG